jgi:hypothetical protein
MEKVRGIVSSAAGRVLFLVGSTVTLLISSVSYGQSDLGSLDEESERVGDMIRIREIGSARATPDTAYLLMKVESESVSLAQALQDNARQIGEFREGLEEIGISGDDVGVKNFVVMPLYVGSGVSLSRNLIITMEGIGERRSEELQQIFAKVQDLGARYGSHCVTCIGSG